MRGKSGRMKIEVKDSTEGEERIFIIALTTPSNDFQMTDLLRQRKVIEPLDSHLKRAVKDATERYLEASDSLVSALASNAKRLRKSRISESGDNRMVPIVVRSFKVPRE